MFVKSKKNGNVCRDQSGIKSFNLKRHIERHHPNVSKSIVEEQAKKQANVQKSSKSKQQIFLKYLLSEKITVSMTKEKFKHHFI